MLHGQCTVLLTNDNAKRDLHAQGDFCMTDLRAHCMDASNPDSFCDTAAKCCTVSESHSESAWTHITEVILGRCLPGEFGHLWQRRALRAGVRAAALQRPIHQRCHCHLHLGQLVEVEQLLGDTVTEPVHKSVLHHLIVAELAVHLTVAGVVSLQLALGLAAVQVSPLGVALAGFAVRELPLTSNALG